MYLSTSPFLQAVMSASPNCMPLAKNASAAAIRSIPEGPYAHESATKAEQAGVVPGAATQNREPPEQGDTQGP